MSFTDNLRTGPFALCDGYLDEKSNIFYKANNSEKGYCCLQTCKPFIEKCEKNCQESSFKKTCRKKCDNIKKLCEDNCKLGSLEIWGLDNPIYKGTNEYGCGTVGSFENPSEQKCLIQNKSKIIQVCRRNCLPTSDINCDDHCKYSFDLIYDKNTNPLTLKNNYETSKKLEHSVSGSKTQSAVQEKPNNNTLLFACFISIVVIIIIFYLCRFL